jgi:hypothetical protein
MHAMALAALLVMADSGASGSPEVPAAEGRVQEAIARLLSAPRADPAWFSPSFLLKVPASSLDGPLRSLQQGMGALRAVVAAASGFRADYERGSISIDAKLDDQGRFAGLFLHPPQLLPGSLDEAVKLFAALPGQVGLLALVDGQPRAALAPDQPLAVGSAFKLAVLAAVRDRVAAGKLGWADVVRLDPKWRSLPSGVLQDWPAGTSLTVESLAAAMISISDNTAADALAALVGRAEVERQAPTRVRPFLTTREAFVLKAPANAPLLARWRKADVGGRRKLLAEIDAQPLPGWWEPSGPADLDVEWHFSARELCALMARLADLPLMTINPGVGQLAPHDRIAFKGGSEPGVINLTVAVQRGPHRACVSATWNDSAHDVDDVRLVVAVRGLLAVLLQ